MAEIGNFNADEHGEMTNFDPIPPDKYEAMIVESEVKATQAGDLNQLILKWRVTSGAYEGRLVWARINLPNRDYPIESLADGKKKAIEIGSKELATICRALGRPRIADSAELHDAPCVIDVRIEPGTQAYPNPKNVIKGYAAIGQSAPVAPPTVSKPAQSAPRQPVGAGAGKAGAPPWARK